MNANENGSKLEKCKKLLDNRKCFLTTLVIWEALCGILYFATIKEVCENKQSFSKAIHTDCSANYFIVFMTAAIVGGAALTAHYYREEIKNLKNWLSDKASNCWFALNGRARTPISSQGNESKIGTPTTGEEKEGLVPFEPATSI